MTKFISSICLLSIVVITAYPSLSRAEDNLPPIEAAWMLRSTLPKAIGKIRTVHELMRWCLYEETQSKPNAQPCHLVEALTKDPNENRDVVRLIKTTLKNLEAEPQTDIVRDHTAALIAALDEMIALRNH